MNRWIFLRHGESTANARRVFAGVEDVMLTDKGIAQADAAGPGIDALLDGERLAQAWSSDLSRARDTGTRALAHCTAGSEVSLQLDVRLRERSLGDWQGMGIDEIKASGKRDVLLTWDGRPPGGESLADLAAAALPCLAAMEGPEPILIVGHGGLIRMLLGLVDDTALNEIGRVIIPNAVPLLRVLHPGTWARLAEKHAPPG